MVVTQILSCFLVKNSEFDHKDKGKKRWKARWFQLQEDGLIYFRKKDRHTFVGRIPLKKATVSFPVKGYLKRQGVFSIVTLSQHDYILRAPTDEDRGIWTHSIGAIIRALSSNINEADSPDAVVQLSQRVNFSDLLGAMQDPDAGVTLASHDIEGVTHKDCFTGDEAVDWLLKWCFASDREDASSIVVVLFTLAHVQMISGAPTTGQEEASKSRLPRQRSIFVDSPAALYRFSSMTPSGSREALLDNSSDSSDTSPVELSEGDVLDSHKTKSKHLKEGFLMKKGHLRTKWKARRVQLTDNPPSIAYFSMKEYNEPLKVHAIKRAMLFDSSNKNTDLLNVGRKKKHVFGVETVEDRLLLFQAENDDDRADWLSAIKSSLNVFNYQTSSQK